MVNNFSRGNNPKRTGIRRVINGINIALTGQTIQNLNISAFYIVISSYLIIESGFLKQNSYSSIKQKNQ